MTPRTQSDRAFVELAERCEKAAGRDARELLTRAYETIFGSPKAIPIATWPGHKMPDRWEEFRALINANAYLDAAMSLVPEGWGWTVRGSGIAELLNPLPPGKSKPSNIDARAATPALALCAAALRARSS